MIAFLREFWAFLRVRKKFWLLAGLHRHGDLRWVDRPHPRLGRGALHLHDLLSTDVRILGLSAFYHDSAAALVEDGRIIAAAQEERFTRKKFDAGYPRRASRLLPARGWHQPQGHRLRRVLRQAVPQIRTPARNLSHLQPARVHARSAWRCRSGCARSCFRRSLLASELQGARAGFRLGRAAALLRASSEPCGFRLLPIARSTRRPFSRWTASANGRRPRSAIGDGKRLAINKEIHFPT